MNIVIDKKSENLMDKLNSAINKNGANIFVFVSAEWCGHCKTMKPEWQQVVKKFNNPQHNINFYNKQDWQIAEVPSMNGHSNARSIAKIYDIFVNDLILEKNILLSKSSIKKCLTETTIRIDESLMLPIRWSQVGLIIRGGWLFGKNKESFGHNGWGGSLGFADPVLGIGVAYTTNKINPTMASDQRIINLLKKFYEI